MSKLYIIATPIGNLEDITFRAVRILKECDSVLCEDTRMTRKLLSHYAIGTHTMSYHAHSKIGKLEKIFEMLEDGKDLALVSDAGTPTISDPGSILVSMVKEKFGIQVQVIPIPGPSAVVAMLSASGLPSSDFLFLGFLPHKKGRETLFKEISESERTVVFYESPHRIEKSLVSLVEHLEPNRIVVVAREITKIFEDFVSGTPLEVMTFFAEHTDKVRGEFVLAVAPKI